MKLPRMWLPAVVFTPLVQNRSLIASGRPSSGRAVPAAMRASETAAMSNALSGVCVTKALSGLASATAFTKACVSSFELIYLAWTASRASTTVISVSDVGIDILFDHLRHDEEIVIA